MKADIERKKRQEKFRKRTKSLFNKARLLAKDTDAWVALVVRDRAGKFQTFRSSDSLHWPPSIEDIIKKHPSGNHQYTPKAISRGRKAHENNDSDSSPSDRGTELVTENPREKSVDSDPVELQSGSIITVNVDRVMEEDGIVSGGAVQLVATVEPRAALVDVLKVPEKDVTDECQDMDYTLINALDHLNTRNDHPPGQCETSINADGETNHTMPSLRNSGNIDKADDTSGHSMTIAELVGSTTTTDALRESDASIHEALEGDAVDSFEVDPTTFGYDLMDLDITEVDQSTKMDGREEYKSKTIVKDVPVVVNKTLPEPSKRMGLLEGWNWVFGRSS